MENSVNNCKKNYFFSRYCEEQWVMHLNSDNIKFTPYNDSNEVVDELFI